MSKTIFLLANIILISSIGVPVDIKSLYLLLDSDAQEDSLINIKKLKGLDIQTHFIQLQDKDPSDLGFENILPLLKKEDKPMSFQDEMKMRLGF